MPLATDWNPSDFLNQEVGDLTKTELLPDGVYHARLTKAEFRFPEAPKAGQEEEIDEKTGEPKEKWPYYNFTFTLTGETPEELHGRNLWVVATLKPKATFVLRQIA